jgi:hypothetical protein
MLGDVIQTMTAVMAAMSRIATIELVIRKRNLLAKMDVAFKNYGIVISMTIVEITAMNQP